MTYGPRTDRWIIPAARVFRQAQSILITDQIPPAQTAVEVEREGDQVVGLKVTCACGREIYAACEYNAPTTT